MRTLRILLLSFLLVFIAVPYVTWRFESEQSRRFAEEERKARAAGGEIYGDCSGVSVILPILIVAHAAAFFIWSLIAVSISGSVGRNRTLIQAILVGTIGAAPSLLIMSVMLPQI